APLDIVIADDRPDWNSSERFPAPRFRRGPGRDRGAGARPWSPRAQPGPLVARPRQTDPARPGAARRPPRRAARSGGGRGSGGGPACAGLTGWRSKGAGLCGRLIAAGIAEEAVQKVHCPIGGGNTGKEPQLVAISMAAQILLEAKNLASL